MSTGSQVNSRSKYARIAGPLLAVALLLAGCSASSSDESAPADADWSAGAAQDSVAEAEGAVGYDDSGESPAQSPAQSPVQRSRDVIVTGDLYITVEDPIAAAASAATIVRDAGGRIDGRSETAADDHSGGSAWLTLRIPSAALDDTVSDLRELGTVDEYRTDSYDVTNEVTDLEAQISTLRASTARIEALLDQAEDISDIIKLETELAERQGTLEGLEARQRGLDDQVAMSTIDLSLTTEPIVVVEEEEPSSFWDGLVSGWNGLIAFLSGFLVVVGVLLPWLVLAAIITFAVIVSIRLGKRRNARHAASKPQPAPVAAPAAAPTQNSAPAVHMPPGEPDATSTPSANSPR